MLFFSAPKNMLVVHNNDMVPPTTQTLQHRAEGRMGAWDAMVDKFFLNFSLYLSLSWIEYAHLVPCGLHSMEIAPAYGVGKGVRLK